MADDDTPQVAQSGVEVEDGTLARILRCDVVSVRRYARNGIIVREKNRKFLLFKAIGDVVEHLRAVAGRQGSADAQRAGAALKDAQRRYTETKLAKLDGQLLSMPEAEAIWGDLVSSAKWLFLALPSRARVKLGAGKIPPDVERELVQVCADMLREVALKGQIQLPTREKLDALDGDGDDDDDTTGPPAPTGHAS